MCLCVCVCVCVRARARVCVCVCVRVRVRERGLCSLTITMFQPEGRSRHLKDLMDEVVIGKWS